MVSRVTLHILQVTKSNSDKVTDIKTKVFEVLIHVRSQGEGPGSPYQIDATLSLRMVNKKTRTRALYS
jgi:hypothetical protein